MAENKTKPTDSSVEQYLAAIEDNHRRKDCEALATIMTKATKLKPKMWGTAIVGFGSHGLKCESGREVDTFLVGFSSRQDDISIDGRGSAPRQEELRVKARGTQDGQGLPLCWQAEGRRCCGS
jgi:hypothetical protein